MKRAPNFDDGRPQRQPYAAGDAFYDLLINGHAGLTDAQSQLMNAQLVLLLANHIGTLPILREALAAARSNVLGPSASAPHPG